MERAWDWTIKKVQQTEKASDIILKDELVQAFQAENPDLSRTTFLSYFGRFMGHASFKSVTPHKKRGKTLGYCHLSFKNNETSESVGLIKEGSLKHDECMSNDDVSNKSKNERTKLKTTTKRKLYVGKNNKSSNKSSYELQNKNTNDIHKVEDELGEEKSSESKTSRLIDPTESGQSVGDVDSEDNKKIKCKKVFDKPQSKKAKLSNCNSKKVNCNANNDNSSEIIGEGISECKINIPVDATESNQGVGDLVLENDRDIELVGSAGSSPENLEPPPDIGGYSLSSDGESSDSDNSDTDYELVDGDVGSDGLCGETYPVDAVRDTESDSDRSVLDNGLVIGDVGCKALDNKFKAADAVNQCNFRKVQSETSLFNSRLFFDNDMWKDPKKLIASKLPGAPKTCDSFLDSLFKGNLYKDLFNVVGASKDPRLTKLRAFIAACFAAPIVGTSGCHEYLQCDGPGGPYPQFSCLKNSSSIACEICVPYQKWAFENKVSHSSLRCKGATLDKIVNSNFTPTFSGQRQVYEHSISKSHLEAIAFVECCEKNVKSQGNERCSKQQSLDNFLLSKKSETDPLN